MFCIVASSLESPAFILLSAVLIEVSIAFNSAFWTSSRRSFISFSILLSCLALSLRAFSSLLSSAFLYRGDNIHAFQLFFCASTATSAAKMLSRFLISCSNRLMTLLISKIDDSKVRLLIRHRAARSCLDFWSAEICAASLKVPDCGVGLGVVFACCVYCEDLVLAFREG